MIDLHINYETVEPFSLERIETDVSPKKKAKTESLFGEIVETVAEVFTVKFEDYKVQVIDLLKRVCTVSVRTMEIINRMPKE